jgi:hypothetical protein
LNLKELLGDPSWLFDFGVPIHEFKPCEIALKPEGLEWELGDEYRIPPLSSLSGERRFAEVSLGWNDEGVFIHAAIQSKEKTYGSSSLFFTFYLDTRWSPGVHRGTSFCHRFEFVLGRPKSSQLLRGHGELSPMQRARAAPSSIHPKDISVGALQREFGYEIKAFLRGDTLTGFEPREFQEVGVFYVINDLMVGSQCMARSRQSPFFEDPSLWCRGRLLQPNS